MAHDTLYIVDNSSEKASVKNYLSEWCSISKQMDIATGYFEIGGLLTLGEDWQKLDKIRIILGNEVTKRTKDVIEEVAQTMIERFRTSMEREQEKNEFLIGVPAIIKAMKSGKIECRVYDSNKFHAKAYITYFRDEYRDQFISAMNVPSGYALVGSSNFTKAGLTQNIELNVQVKDEVEQLQKWFDEHWQNGTDITEAVLKVMEMHCREFSPYDVYLRSMYEYFKSHEETVSEWEENESVVYKGLSQYQKDGYNSLIQIAEHYSGAFLCDGVGLGKTFVGMMLIERLGGVLKYSDVADRVFRSNLLMIDLHFPRVLTEMIRIMHLDGISRISELTEVIKQMNPLKIKDELINKHCFYEFKIKQFLMALALGMRPAKIYNGQDSAVEGILLVGGNGEVLCYHKSEKQVMEDFLFRNTRLEKGSLDKDKYGFLEKENGVYYFKLNAKIGLVKR